MKLRSQPQGVLQKYILCGAMFMSICAVLKTDHGYAQIEAKIKSPIHRQNLEDAFDAADEESFKDLRNLGFEMMLAVGHLDRYIRWQHSDVSFMVDRSERLISLNALQSRMIALESFRSSIYLNLQKLKGWLHTLEENEPEICTELSYMDLKKNMKDVAAEYAKARVLFMETRAMFKSVGENIE